MDTCVGLDTVGDIEGETEVIKSLGGSIVRAYFTPSGHPLATMRLTIWRDRDEAFIETAGCGDSIGFNELIELAEEHGVEFDLMDPDLVQTTPAGLIVHGYFQEDTICH